MSRVSRIKRAVELIPSAPAAAAVDAGALLAADDPQDEGEGVLDLTAAGPTAAAAAVLR